MANIISYVLGKNLYSVMKGPGAVQENRITTRMLDSDISIEYRCMQPNI